MILARSPDHVSVAVVQELVDLQGLLGTGFVVVESGTENSGNVPDDVHFTANNIQAEGGLRILPD